RLDYQALRAVLVRHGQERSRVLREARAAVAGPRVQEEATYAIVHAHRARNIVHVAAYLVAEVRDLVDEGNLRRQKRVRGVLGQLRRLKRRDDHRSFYQVERAEEVAHDGDGRLVAAADDDAVRAHEVVNGRALAQELRVRDYAEVKLLLVLAYEPAQTLARADGDCGFGDDDLVAVHVAGDVARGLLDEAKVCRAVFLRRRAHGEEDDEALLDSRAYVRSEV